MATRPDAADRAGLSRPDPGSSLETMRETGSTNFDAVERDDATADAAEPAEERTFEPILLASLIVGFVFGAATAIAMYAMFPKTSEGWMLPLSKDASWHPPILAIVSALLLIVAYVSLRRRGAVEIADRLFLGYVGALSTAAGLEVAREMWIMVRAHAAANLGASLWEMTRFWV
jgi:hypothetical protein